MYVKFKEFLESGKDIRDGEWNNKEVYNISSLRSLSHSCPSLIFPLPKVELLNKILFLTAKPVVYLINMSTEDYVTKKNKWLGKVLFSVSFSYPSPTSYHFLLSHPLRPSLSCFLPFVVSSSKLIVILA